MSNVIHYCTFCGNVATHVIANYMADINGLGRQFNTPICSACKEIYECGQASPDASISGIEKDED